jgi:hypothetical protein
VVKPFPAGTRSWAMGRSNLGRELRQSCHVGREPHRIAVRTTIEGGGSIGSERPPHYRWQSLAVLVRLRRVQR